MSLESKCYQCHLLAALWEYLLHEYVSIISGSEYKKTGKMRGE